MKSKTESQFSAFFNEYKFPIISTIILAIVVILFAKYLNSTNQDWLAVILSIPINICITLLVVDVINRNNDHKKKMTHMRQFYPILSEQLFLFLHHYILFLSWVFDEKQFDFKQEIMCKIDTHHTTTIPLQIDRLVLLQKTWKPQYPFLVDIKDGKEHLTDLGKDSFFNASRYIYCLERTVMNMPRIMVDTHIAFFLEYNDLRGAWEQAHNCLANNSIPSAEALYRLMTDQIIKFASLCLEEMKKVKYMDQNTEPYIPSSATLTLTRTLTSRAHPS